MVAGDLATKLKTAAVKSPKFQVLANLEFLQEKNIFQNFFKIIFKHAPLASTQNTPGVVYTTEPVKCKKNKEGETKEEEEKRETKKRLDGGACQVAEKLEYTYRDGWISFLFLACCFGLGFFSYLKRTGDDHYYYILLLSPDAQTHTMRCAFRKYFIRIKTLDKFALSCRIIQFCVCLDHLAPRKSINTFLKLNSSIRYSSVLGRA